MPNESYLKIKCFLLSATVLLSAGIAVAETAILFEDVHAVELPKRDYGYRGMPGTIVEALLERYRRFHPTIPILKMAYDGLTHVGEDTRIEAFVYQTAQHAETHASQPVRA